MVLIRTESRTLALSFDRRPLDTTTLAKRDTGRGTARLSIVNESGLYSLILKSRKPEANAFKKWVTSVVLPAIRKDGAYCDSPPHGNRERPFVVRLGCRWDGRAGPIAGGFCRVVSLSPRIRKEAGSRPRPPPNLQGVPQCEYLPPPLGDPHHPDHRRLLDHSSLYGLDERGVGVRGQG